LEYGFDELKNLEKSNNKKTRDVTDHGEATNEGLSQDDGNSPGEGEGDLGQGHFSCETVVLRIDFL
jgi:hypothetical protein